MSTAVRAGWLGAEISLSGVELHIIVRGILRPEGLLALGEANRNPAEDPGLRAQLVTIARGLYQPDWASDAGLHYDADGHLVRNYLGLITWQQVWDIVSPGITAERVAKLRQVWDANADARRRHGPHLDMESHLAACALLRGPEPKPVPVQLGLFDLAGVP